MPLHHASGDTAADEGDIPPSYEDYHIAWICALYIEVAAAQAMLDEVYESAAGVEGGTGHVLGRIRHHNVIIASLPDTQYGTNNAAIVATDLKRIFPSVKYGLVVGIGGGVPGKDAEIRLGDIVVGTRVVQHDLSKITGREQVERIATPRILPLSLGRAVSTLRAKHELDGSQVSLILQEKMANYPAYARPKVPDRLFLKEYRHEVLSHSCDACDPSKVVVRADRSSIDPIMHYGTIASGNQVIKDAIMRDEIAQEWNVLCFEMETAGLMDVLPCISIRGICDYSDSHKSKEWQRYAAASAAAYAREFLEMIPHVPRAGSLLSTGTDQRSFDHRVMLLDSLRLDCVNSRKYNIKVAHHKTCEWLVAHPAYRAWLDPRQLRKHRGVLWINGKPGAGKSTMMHFAYNQAKRDQPDYGLIMSFFFNARGERLETSIVGLYRSLLLQLLEGFPKLQDILDDPDLKQSSLFSTNMLQDLFRTSVLKLRGNPLTCFVDALDECDEREAADAAYYFEVLTEHCSHGCIPLRLCLSTRHYPHFDTLNSLHLTLEDQPNHDRDLERYVDSSLRVQNSAIVQDLKRFILQKAAGVFLWVVLVVDILNSEDRRGRPTLQKTLSEIPAGLSDLIHDILTGGHDTNMEELLMCISWILFSKRPLSPKEYYHGLWSGLHSMGQGDTIVPNMSIYTGDSIRRYIISSSKGLAEVIESAQPVVQFIHESVRDFLLQPSGVKRLWPNIGHDQESASHERLKECCHIYLNHPSVKQSIAKWQCRPTRQLQKELSDKFPFLEYASRHLLYHANLAALAINQDDFFTRLSLPDLTSIWNMLEFKEYESPPYGADINLLYILAERGCPNLIRAQLRHTHRTSIAGGKHHYPLFAALVHGERSAFLALLGLSSSLYKGVDITHNLKFKDSKKYRTRTPLTWASRDGCLEIVERILLTEGNVNEIDQGGNTPLLEATNNNHEMIVKLLVDAGADVNIHDGHGRSPLFWASYNGNDAITSFLVHHGADVDVCNDTGWTPLLVALHCVHDQIAQLLIKTGADVNASRDNGRTPLMEACSRNQELIVSLLLDAGADVNVGDNNGWTPLIWASKNGSEAAVKLLLSRGANINLASKQGKTPLEEASNNGYYTVAKLLNEAKVQSITGSNSSCKTSQQTSQDNDYKLRPAVAEDGAGLDIAITTEPDADYDELVDLVEKWTL
ncbi:unnamed protein product [Clonostachys rosea]|uniref:Nucleoside phosphorylase domain-containing protein n=1 Tax=Bionectria ochroleuca TaxID=29856 RepID=A0ABY6TQ58_BIOOC|nr:unnamed protein product [Clonostachys rosea]